MTLVSLLKQRCKPGSSSRWVLLGLYHHPWRFPLTLLRSAMCNKRLCGRYWPIQVRLALGQRFKVNNSPSQAVQIDGILTVSPWGGLDSPSSLTLGAESCFVLLGDFWVGPGVHIDVLPGASLKIAGRLKSSLSGITCNSRIMVEKSVEIGHDSIIAWDVYISDSDWHDIKSVQRAAPVSIGSKVWISHGVSILKGAAIPSGCIVGAKSLVTSVIGTERALVAGIPATVRKTGVEWSR